MENGSISCSSSLLWAAADVVFEVLEKLIGAGEEADSESRAAFFLDETVVVAEVDEYDGGG